MSDVPVTVKRIKVSDFEVLRNAVQDAEEHDIVQLENGKMTGDLTHLSVGSIGISHGRFDRAMRLRGVGSKNRWLFGTLLVAPALIKNVETPAGDIVIEMPGHEQYLRYYGGNAYAAIFVEPDELFAFLASQPGARDAVVSQANSVLVSDPATAAARISSLSSLLAMFTTHGPMLSDGAVEFYKRGVLELVTAPIIERASLRYRGRRPESALTLVRDVERYLIDAGSRPVHITELIEKFGVHERSLYRAFDDVLGIPPMTFLRHKRLGDVHTVLLQGGPDLMLKDIAKEHGFLDYPRFAREYRRLFGERPAHTLRRRGGSGAH
ncbi:helix-turn-helix domain-containing protein [Bradyrhizobium sp. USDA 4508]